MKHRIAKKILSRIGEHYTLTQRRTAFRRLGYIYGGNGRWYPPGSFSALLMRYPRLKINADYFGGSLEPQG